MPKILVVDDTAVDRQIAGGLLKELPNMEIDFAENGEQAITRMHQSRPDLVVTDLQMPEMDGLELVTRIRLQFPSVPVILLTAQGSEEIAVRALQKGAASYVPKSQISQTLCSTVSDVLAISDSDETYTQLMKCQDRIEFSFTLDNKPELIDALVDLVQQVIGGMDFTDHTGKFRIGVALREALVNAMVRGNLEITNQQLQADGSDSLVKSAAQLIQQRSQQEPYKNRKIQVDAYITRKNARFVIRDDGTGFADAAAFNQGDLSSVHSANSRQGRGIVLMRSLMDEVTYNAVGNKVTLCKSPDAHHFTAE